MNDKLKKYLDKIINSVIECDYHCHLPDYENYYVDFDIFSFPVGDYLPNYEYWIISGCTDYNEFEFDKFVICKSDYDNWHEVRDYILDKLNEYNNEQCEQFDNECCQDDD